MEESTCNSTVFPGLVVSVLALLLEQYLGTTSNIKANSIAGLLMNVGQTLLSSPKPSIPAIGKGPHPLPPAEVVTAPGPLLS